jgi:hypothetical protein
MNFSIEHMLVIKLIEIDSNQNRTRAELKMRAVEVTSGVSNNYYLRIKIINITK